LEGAESGKTIIFRAKAKFFGQKPAAKNEKIYFLYLLNEKKQSGEAILQVSIAVSFGCCRNIFRAKMAQPPRKNWPVRL